MPADLSDLDAPDEEDFVVSYMQELMNSATERDTDDNLPFCTVTRIAGADDPFEGIDDSIIQLDFLAVGVQAAKQAATQGHRRMSYLATRDVTVALSDGSQAAADYLQTIQKPIRLPYMNDQIVRYTARYKLGLSYVAVQP